MYRRLVCGLALIVATGLVQLGRVWPAAADRSHVALVIGNAAYKNGPLATASNDAGLVAEALNSAGFEVVAGADLSQAEMRAAFRNFLTMVATAGPDVDALVYFAGYGLELDGKITCSQSMFDWSKLMMYQWSPCPSSPCASAYRNIRCKQDRDPRRRARASFRPKGRSCDARLCRSRCSARADFCDVVCPD